MIPFKFHIVTKALFGSDIVKENKTELGRCGKKALVVTGKTSAKACGALGDIGEMLSEQNVEYRIFDRVENNPSLDTVEEGGRMARDFNADMIVGIGGGSPLDAAKAIAVLATNTMDPVELYKGTYVNKPLPIIAVPTTAGTGSEVTPYSILTRKDMQMKMSFGNEDLFPKLAFLDPRYTESLPRNITIDTAVDAFSHAVEGYLSRRSMPVSDVLAIEAIRIFGLCVKPLLENSITIDIREKMLYMSMLGGIVISHTGTTIVHGMGYALTFFKNMPHGRANGLLMEEYFKFNYGDAKDKIDKIIRAMGLSSLDEFGEKMDLLLQEKVLLTDEEISLYASLTMKQRSTVNNPKSVTEGDIAAILKRAGRG
jgi:alcohol dehydrogenase class IV